MHCVIMIATDSPESVSIRPIDPRDDKVDLPVRSSFLSMKRVYYVWFLYVLCVYGVYKKDSKSDKSGEDEKEAM